MVWVLTAILSFSISAGAKDKLKTQNKVYISFVELDQPPQQKRQPAKVSDEMFKEAIDNTSIKQKALQHKILTNLKVTRDNVRLRTDLSEMIEKHKPISENIVVQSDIFEQETLTQKQPGINDKGVRRISEEVNKALEN